MRCFFLFYIFLAGVRAQASEPELLISFVKANVGYSVKLENNYRNKIKTTFDKINIYLIKSQYPIKKLDSLKVFVVDDLAFDALFVPLSELAYGYKSQNKLNFIIKSDIIGTPVFYDLLLHEYFHALHYMSNQSQELWLREGLAQYFSYKVTNNFNQNHIDSILKSSLKSLISNNKIYEFKKYNYADTFLFINYIVSNCGKNIFWELMISKERGVNAIDESLNKISKKNNICSNFESVFIHYQVAKNYNKVIILNDKISYKYSLKLPVQLGLPAKMYRSANSIEKAVFSMPSFSSLKIDMSAIRSENLNNLNINCSDCKIFWLRKYLKNNFEVINKKPKDPSRWDLLIIKL